MEELIKLDDMDGFKGICLDQNKILIWAGHIAEWLNNCMGQFSVDDALLNKAGKRMDDADDMLESVRNGGIYKGSRLDRAKYMFVKGYFMSGVAAYQRQNTFTHLPAEGYSFGESIQLHKEAMGYYEKGIKLLRKEKDRILIKGARRLIADDLSDLGKAYYQMGWGETFRKEDELYGYELHVRAYKLRKAYSPEPSRMAENLIYMAKTLVEAYKLDESTSKKRPQTMKMIKCLNESISLKKPEYDPYGLMDSALDQIKDIIPKSTPEEKEAFEVLELKYREIMNQERLRW